MTSLLRGPVLLLLTLLSLAFDSHAREFQNLDFEGTTFDFELLRDTHPYHIEATHDINTMIPGWSLRSENEDGSVFSVFDPDVHYYNFVVGDLGEGWQTLLASTNPNRSPGWADSDRYQGEHFLYLQNGSRSEPSNVGVETFFLKNVAFQTGVIPADAKTVLIQSDSVDFAYEQVEVTPEIPDGILTITVPRFQVLFNGFAADVRQVSLANYPDVYDPQPGTPAPSQQAQYWAANIESIAGLERELAVQPSQFVRYLDSDFISFDNILFSTTPTAGRPVRAPEPLAAFLAVAVLPATASRRR
ncbi:hypothetical protein KOR34_31910 [Posidoniimonas corsicana]|uniref:Uncharacterized protein n=1 Tax=Posidoniimonas corsicana TaxID=1938618 RepID=A0A5C5VKH7_9BACT|nr:hypothetical protein [Posidoniimonas corsicana]TWT38222.1 hypothetical protein KOR34_31910 [Posidoniimonas corsicana]